VIKIRQGGDSMKIRRQEMILQAVATGTISTQEQLLSYLLEHGLNATQATVSRDMKDLGLQKSKRGGKNYYEAAQKSEVTPVENLFLMEAIRSVDGAGNMVCLRCRSGMAQAVCAALDNAPLPGVLGSLAGEDTIFLLCSGEEAMRAVKAELMKLIED
jgi:transcriptional regulator of arginine metabolism